MTQGTELSPRVRMGSSLLVAGGLADCPSVG